MSCCVTQWSWWGCHSQKIKKISENHSNKTKTAIWEHLHLRFYTQYSYNKWHTTLHLGPFCHEIPDDIYHVMLNCGFTDTWWADLQPTLCRFENIGVNEQEKALGLVNVRSSPGILLRNWVTFRIRKQIMNFERKAYYSGRPSIDSFKVHFNQAMAKLLSLRLTS